MPVCLASIPLSFLISVNLLVAQTSSSFSQAWSVLPPLVAPTTGQASAIPVGAPPKGIVEVSAVRQESDGDWRHLRGAAEIRTSDSYLRADEIDWNVATGEAEARGGVYFKSYLRGEELWADRVEYNLKTQSGKFYQVRGNSQVKFDSRPGLLRTNNPVYFQGTWAERLGDRYILYDGTLTNCDPQQPWWTLRGPKFDIIPDDRALAYHSILRIKHLPVLYAPIFYKSLKEEDRRSGFLTPTFGNSSRRGLMVGTGYYWAISRSFDATYLSQYFSQRGFAHNAEFRGKPSRTSEFTSYVYGVNDRGELLDNGQRNKQGGYLVNVTGQWHLPKGWFAKGDFNYLSSFLFRQAFTETFTEAVSSEVTSLGWLQKQWGYNTFDVVFSRFENFQSTAPDDKIAIRKLPQVELFGRDRKLFKHGPPIYVSWQMQGGLLRRTQPLFQTRQYVQRIRSLPPCDGAHALEGFHSHTLVRRARDGLRIEHRERRHRRRKPAAKQPGIRRRADFAVARAHL